MSHQHLILAIGILISQCAIAGDRDIGTFLTGAFASRFCDEAQSDPKLTTLPSGHRVFTYRILSIKVAPGGSILSKSTFEKDKRDMDTFRRYFKEHSNEAGLIAFSADMRYPSIGARAIYTAFGDGQGLRFTTTDERFDIDIEDSICSCRILDFAKSLIELYEQTK